MSPADDKIRGAEQGGDLALLLRDGYLVVPSAVPEALCDAANAGLDDFKARNRRAIARNVDEAGRLYRVANLHLAVDALAELCSANGALPVCDQFFDSETALYTSLLFERGSEQALHRDSPLFVTRPEGRYLGVWVALEDIDAENGPLVVVPHSHSLPKLDVEAMALELYGDPADAPPREPVGWKTYQGAVREQSVAEALTPMEIHVRRGDVIIWHPLLLHGGAPHRSPERTRRSFVMHVTPVGVPVYRQDVFFNPRRQVPDSPPWGYYERGGRKIAKFDSVDFGHEYTRSISLLQRPDAGAGERLRVTARRVKSRVRGLARP